MDDMRGHEIASCVGFRRLQMQADGAFDAAGRATRERFAATHDLHWNRQAHRQSPCMNTACYYIHRIRPRQGGQIKECFHRCAIVCLAGLNEIKIATMKGAYGWARTFYLRRRPS
ncbi:MAG TPA: hypothetical protein VJ652_11660 [Noviherbaspirillum sp.]|nr:hypothetical protein [Noviherbaspirillum sp.]